MAAGCESTHTRPRRRTHLPRPERAESCSLWPRQPGLVAGRCTAVFAPDAGRTVRVDAST